MPVGLAWAQFAPGLVGLSFSWKKQGIIGNTIHLYLFYFVSVVRGGRNGWRRMGLDDDFPIRQVLPVGAQFCFWAHWAWVFTPKKYVL